jgi:outer membrane lipoprotein SlyB
LDATTRQYMEARFAHDFSRVRVHTDDRAASTATALHARAYTVENDVVFAPGAYAPGTRDGARLLAHELTHVVQQSNGGGASQAKSVISRRTDQAELEAERVAADGGATHVTQHPAAAIQGDWLEGAGLGALAGAVVGGLAGLALGGIGGALVGGSLGLLIGGVVGGLIQSRARRGTWAITQRNTDGANYSSDVHIAFTPDPAKVDCADIAFVQTVKFSDQATHRSVETIPNYVQRRTAAGWTLDRIDQRSYGWYGYNNNGLPGGLVTPGKSSPLTPARLHDTPSDVRPNSTFEFETSAICRSGPHANQLFGAFHWGFDVDAANHLTSRATSDTNAPSAEFNEAVKQWNIQAAGPAATRNDPAQQPLGPFRR